MTFINVERRLLNVSLTRKTKYLSNDEFRRIILNVRGENIELNSQHTKYDDKNVFDHREAIFPIGYTL